MAQQGGGAGPGGIGAVLVFLAALIAIMALIRVINWLAESYRNASRRLCDQPGCRPDLSDTRRWRCASCGQRYCGKHGAMQGNGEFWCVRCLADRQAHRAQE